MAEIRAKDIVKVFPDGSRALDGVSFLARSGRVLTLLGPSGCGKSTLLRIVAGLERADHGSLELDGRPLDDVPAGKRGAGFVFQNYALYPHLTVEGNLSLALEAQKVPRAEIRQRVRETAELLGIAGLLHRRPGQISGGQQQRVALGRALVRRPAFYLLDEPLSNLDALLRESTRGDLKTLFARVGATVIYVTHDQVEAMSLSDDMVVMRAGRILQSGTPLAIYRRPADTFVATFVGSPRMTLWRGRRDSGCLDCRGVKVPLPQGLAANGNGELCVGMRPEDAEISTHKLAGGWQVERTVIEPLGPSVLVTVNVGGETARVLAEPAQWPQKLWMRWRQDRMHWYDGQTGGRLSVPGEPAD